MLTDIHNKEGWEQGREEGQVPDNIRVRFLRDRSACSKNRFVAHLQSWLNYRSFNTQVLAAANEWHREVGFDLCHQVTIAAWRMPSPLWRLPIPFVWGPIGGAGYIPPVFRPMLSPASRQFERVRDWQSALALRSRAFRACIRETAVVFAANEETEVLLKPYREDRPMFRLPIASVSEEKAERFRRREPATVEDGPLRLFAGGNMEGRKGLSLALKALAKVAERGVDFRYTIAGGGPEIPAMKALAETLELGERVEFHEGYRGDAYIGALHRSDVYFLPSFRESTPVTLLEAVLSGCYPVVADTSAQGEIVRLVGGSAVPVESVQQLIQGLADAVVWCAEHRGELLELANEAGAKVADQFSSTSYDRTVEEAYRIASASR
ncbi:glycosyltransferase group 1 family [Haloferula helveola]|uniref:Glycosyltransferase group 1 family n=1 Tax=Haloferula helveola TaxID=490095 RepID=A0ABM7RDX7_9BACT|nr:glycosyltransferase group 1 family [Haloferula helveola]